MFLKKIVKSKHIEFWIFLELTLSSFFVGGNSVAFLAFEGLTSSLGFSGFGVAAVFTGSGFLVSPVFELFDSSLVDFFDVSSLLVVVGFLSDLDFFGLCWSSSTSFSFLAFTVVFSAEDFFASLVISVSFSGLLTDFLDFFSSSEGCCCCPLAFMASSTWSFVLVVTVSFFSDCWSFDPFPEKFS